MHITSREHKIRTTVYLSLLLLSAVLMSGCVTGQSVRALTPGMSRAEVIKVMGKPDGFKVAGEYTALKYANRLLSGWSWDTTDYTLILKDDKLIEYGPGEIREREVGGFQTLFIHQNVSGSLNHNIVR